MLHSPRWEAWDWILIELVSKAARSYEASRVGRKALQTQLTEFWYSASSWKRVKARGAPHPQQWLWIAHVLGDAEGPITLEKVQGFFPHMQCHNMNMKLFVWALGAGITTQHWTALPCSTWPLGGMFAPCLISTFLWETQQSNWAPGRGTSPSSGEAVPCIKVVFWTKAREETRMNYLNQCQRAQVEMKFSPLLHSHILNNLTWVS